MNGDAAPNVVSYSRVVIHILFCRPPTARLKRELEGTASEDSDDGAKKVEKRKKKFGKNPDVDTSFLPDRDREDEDNAMRESLR